jgi:hypothetical protein
MPTAAASPIERAHCRVEPASVYGRLKSATSAGTAAGSVSSMKITPSKSQPNTGVVQMVFEWLNDSRTSNKRDEIAPPRSPMLPASSEVTRICGNFATSPWLKVRTFTEGCGRVQVAGGGRIGRCRCWVKGRRGWQADGTAGLPPAPEIRASSRTYVSCQKLTCWPSRPQAPSLRQLVE